MKRFLLLFVLVALSLDGVQCCGPLLAVDTYSTPGTFTWTCPTGVTSVDVVCIGGGAGGAGGTMVGGGKGGGGGGYSSKTVAVTPGTGYSLSVGAGGTGGAAGSSSQGLGGPSTFGMLASPQYVSALGAGNENGAGAGSGTINNPGRSASGSVSMVSYGKGGGAAGNAAGSSTDGSLSTGGSPNGGNGGTTFGAAGAAGTAYGGGGGGGFGNGTMNGPGGAGSGGVVILTYSAGAVPGMPAISPAGGSFTGSVLVTITPGSGAVNTYYTTNGSDPFVYGTAYTAPFTVTAPFAGNVRAVSDNAYGAGPNDIQSFTVTAGGTVAAPVFSPTAVTFGTSVSVNITSATSGATIHYTTDGSTPTTASPVWPGATSVTTSAQYKALAVKSGYTNSSITTQNYVNQSVSGSGYFTVSPAPTPGVCLPLPVTLNFTIYDFPNAPLNLLITGGVQAPGWGMPLAGVPGLYSLVFIPGDSTSAPAINNGDDVLLGGSFVSHGIPHATGPLPVASYGATKLVNGMTRQVTFNGPCTGNCSLRGWAFVVYTTDPVGTNVAYVRSQPVFLDYCWTNATGPSGCYQPSSTLGANKCPDTDGDGLSDVLETYYQSQGFVPMDPATAMSDSDDGDLDGIPDRWELILAACALAPCQCTDADFQLALIAKYGTTAYDPFAAIGNSSLTRADFDSDGDDQLDASILQCTITAATGHCCNCCCPACMQEAKDQYTPPDMPQEPVYDQPEEEEEPFDPLEPVVPQPWPTIWESPFSGITPAPFVLTIDLSWLPYFPWSYTFAADDIPGSFTIPSASGAGTTLASGFDIFRVGMRATLSWVLAIWAGATAFRRIKETLL
jgi:hypothetical protein